MAQLLKQNYYVMRCSKGPVLFVDGKELAELLLSRANLKFRQDIKLEKCQRKETDH